jgi:hypothetical protein
MKILLHQHQFNDKTFWMMFSAQEAIEHFQPDYRQWEAQGISFYLEDLNHDEKYIRNIVITAEATTEQGLKALTALVLKTQNK